MQRVVAKQETGRVQLATDRASLCRSRGEYGEDLSVNTSLAGSGEADGQEAPIDDVYVRE
jgi:hypothetical protein